MEETRTTRQKRSASRFGRVAYRADVQPPDACFQHCAMERSGLTGGEGCWYAVMVDRASVVFRRSRHPDVLAGLELGFAEPESAALPLLIGILVALLTLGLHA